MNQIVNPMPGATKPGFLTTEFWSLVSTHLLSILALAGVFNTHSTTGNTAVKAAAVLAMAGVSWGYAHSRGKVKAALGYISQLFTEAGLPVDSTLEVTSSGGLIPGNGGNGGSGAVVTGPVSMTVPPDTGDVPNAVAPPAAAPDVSDAAAAQS